MITVIDKVGIANVLKELFEADTSVLYGSSKLVQTISTSAVDFVQAKVDNNKPYKLFLICEDKQTVEVLPQTARHRYIVSYRIEGVMITPETARAQIDDIDARIDVLINSQMHTGNMFVPYYSDSTNRIVDAEYDNSGLITDMRGERIFAECSGAISISVIKYSS